MGDQTRKKSADGQESKKTKKRQKPQRMSHDSIAFLILGGVCAVGVVCVLGYSFQASNVSGGLSIIAFGLLLGGASRLVGALLGFLFGIPRSLSRIRNEKYSKQQSPCRCQSDGCCCSDWWATEPELGRVAYGVANRVDRLRALGDGQVPAVVATAWKILWEEE